MEPQIRCRGARSGLAVGILLGVTYKGFDYGLMPPAEVVQLT